jgi:hypothetical protein
LSYKEWCKDTFENLTCQQYLEGKLDALVTVFFNENEKYVIEKFTKSFCEGLCYLEKLLLYKRGIHPTQFEKVTFIADSKELSDKYLEIENILISEINRQYRNYTIFLPQIRLSLSK